MSATNINPYDTLIARPCDSEDDPLLGPPKQQPRGTGTTAPTGLDSIQQTIKDVMRESIKDLKNDILAPLAQRIIDMEERVAKIENKMSANTKTAHQNKEAQKKNRQHDSEIKQNRAIKVFHNKKIYTPTTQLHKELRYILVKDIKKINVCKFVY